MSGIGTAARIIAAAVVEGLGPQLDRHLDEARLTSEVVRVRARELVRLQAEAAILRLTGDTEAATLVEAAIKSSLASLSARKASRIALDLVTSRLRTAVARL